MDPDGPGRAVCTPIMQSAAAAGTRIAKGNSSPTEEDAMHFQVRTDNHLENSEALTEALRAEVEAAVPPRFTDRLRRVEVYLQDVNSHKGGVDQRCTIEAHLAGHPPVVVHEQAA